MTGLPLESVTTGRMFICALRVSELRSSFPGTVMTSCRAPSIWISAPATPDPLTRLSMMERACAIWALVGSDPSVVRAVSVMRVPPCRSMPSLGVLEPGVKNTSP